MGLTCVDGNTEAQMSQIGRVMAHPPDFCATKPQKLEITRLCYCEMPIPSSTKSAAECHQEMEAASQDTYIAFYMTREISISSVISQILKPFGKFGEFISDLFPVKGIKVAARMHIKLPLAGLAHFIFQFEVEIKINCGIIDAIKARVQSTEDMLGEQGQIWDQLPGAGAIDAFCDPAKPETVSATISIGFDGINLDRKKSFVEVGANDNKARLDFDIFPSCPPPVLTGGDCSENDDCISSDKDPEAAGCSGFDGYCMNNPDWKSSTGCSGTCVEKLDIGGDCSKEAVNIHERHPTFMLASGDGNACKSGECICTKCAGIEGVPNEYRCSENSDCESGWCEGCFNGLCSGTCKPKRYEGYTCFGGYDDSCESGKCSGLEGCNTCQNELGLIPVSSYSDPWAHDTHVCRMNGDCQSGWCERGDAGCGGRCMLQRPL